MYFELLIDHFQPLFEKTWAKFLSRMGGSSHTAEVVTGWLNNSEFDLIKDRPGSSLDISLIEALWAIMKAKLQAHYTSLTKLEAELLNCWAEFKHETLQNLADSSIVYQNVSKRN